MLPTLNWNDLYTVSRALVFQIGDGGELLVRRSLSQPLQVVPRDHLRLLLAFADGSTPSRALACLRDEPRLAEARFAEAVSGMLAEHLLVPCDTARPVAFQATGGFGSAVIQYPMVRDTVRVETYRRAIFRHCRDRLVAEIGCGSGILSIFAAQAGARKVIAIEETRIAEVAAEMFRTNGVADRVELRRANSLDVTLDPRAEVIVHELFGSDPFAENLLAFIEDARERLLAPGGRLIPFALEVWCVGFETEESPYFDRERAVAEVAALEGRYGVDLGTFRQAVETAAAMYLRRPVGDLGGERFQAPLLTEPVRLYDLDFRPGSSLAAEPRSDLSLRVTRAGSLGGVLVYFVAHLDEDIVLSTAPDAPCARSWKWDARPLDRRIAVEPGQQLPILVEVRTADGVDGLHVALA